MTRPFRSLLALLIAFALPSLDAGTCKQDDCKFTSAAGSFKIETDGVQLDGIPLLLFDENGDPINSLDLDNTEGASCSFETSCSAANLIAGCLGELGCESGKADDNKEYTWSSTKVGGEIRVELSNGSLSSYAGTQGTFDPSSVEWDGGARGIYESGKSFAPYHDSDFLVGGVHMFPSTGEYEVGRSFTTAKCDCDGQRTKETLLVSWPTPGGTIDWFDGSTEDRVVCVLSQTDVTIASPSPSSLFDRIQVSWESRRESPVVIIDNSTDHNQWLEIPGEDELELSAATVRSRVKEFSGSSASDTVLFRRVFYDPLRDETTYSNQLSVEADDTSPVIDLQNREQFVCDENDLTWLSPVVPSDCTNTTYAWYKYTHLDRVPQLLASQTTKRYTPRNLTPEVAHYYYCEVTCEENGLICSFVTKHAFIVKTDQLNLEYYPDNDGDGFGDTNGTLLETCGDPGAGWALGSKGHDCNDNKPNRFPGQIWYQDLDGDGAPGPDTALENCGFPGSGYKVFINFAIQEFDCDDSDPNTHPKQKWYTDSDGDGYAEDGQFIEDCLGRPGLTKEADLASTTDFDCNDNRADIHPATEWYRDDDFDGRRASNTPFAITCFRPAEGYLDSSLRGLDCDDSDPTVGSKTKYYKDEDGDGYPAQLASDNKPDTRQRCGPGDGYTVLAEDLISTKELDCDDSDPLSFPGQRWYPDSDGDGRGDPRENFVEDCKPSGGGYVTNHSDCDDSNASVGACDPDEFAGNALVLRRASENVVVQDDRLGKFGKSDFSISLWIKRPRIQTKQLILSRGRLCQGNPTDQFWRLDTLESGKLRFRIQTLASDRVDLESTTAVDNDEWRHIVLRRQSDALEIWIDGQLDAEASSDIVHDLDESANLTFGVGQLQCGQSFSGLVDEVSIWSTALPETSIQLEEFHALAAQQPSAIAYWQFNEDDDGNGNGLLVTDAIGGYVADASSRAGRDASTVPIGPGLSQRAVVDGSLAQLTASFPDLSSSIASAQISGNVGTIVDLTCLEAVPNGTLPPGGAGTLHTGHYWILRDQGPDALVRGELVLQVGAGVIDDAVSEQPEVVKLFHRNIRSDTGWSKLTEGTSATTGGEVTFASADVSGQLAIVIGEPSEIVEENTPFRRGDADSSGVVEITDAVGILGFLFLGQAAPSCLDTADTDDNGEVDLTDAVGVLNHLFSGGEEPASPGPYNCGLDPEGSESLGCDAYEACGM